MNEQELRKAIVDEALSWVGTPYHLGACVKGAGVDCATLIYGVMHGAGIIDKQEIGIFSHDWFCHTKEEVYMKRVIRHAYKLVEGKSYPSLKALPGCICLIRAAGSKVFNHGAIVVEWPIVVHAIHPAVQKINASTNPMTTHQMVAIYDPVPVTLERLVKT